MNKTVLEVSRERYTFNLVYRFINIHQRIYNIIYKLLYIPVNLSHLPNCNNLLVILLRTFQ